MEIVTVVMLTIGYGGVGVGVGLGDGLGLGLNPKSTSMRSMYLLRPQSFEVFLVIYPKPLSPQFVPHEFFINQCVELYPTKRTA